MAEHQSGPRDGEVPPHPERESPKIIEIGCGERREDLSLNIVAELRPPANDQERLGFREIAATHEGYIGEVETTKNDSPKNERYSIAQVDLLGGGSEQALRALRAQEKLLLSPDAGGRGGMSRAELDHLYERLQQGSVVSLIFDHQLGTMRAVEAASSYSVGNLTFSTHGQVIRIAVKQKKGMGSQTVAVERYGARENNETSDGIEPESPESPAPEPPSREIPAQPSSPAETERSETSTEEDGEALSREAERLSRRRWRRQAVLGTIAAGLTLTTLFAGGKVISQNEEKVPRPQSTSSTPLSSPERPAATSYINAGGITKLITNPQMYNMESYDGINKEAIIGTINVQAQSQQLSLEGGISHSLSPSVKNRLISTVLSNKHFLEAAGKKGYVEQISFRIAEPEESETLRALQSSFYYYDPGTDEHGGVKVRPAAIIYSFPAQGMIDSLSMSIMMGHELAHGVFGDGVEHMDPQQRQTLEAAVHSLRAISEREMKASGATAKFIDKLELLRDKLSDPAQVDVVDQVIEALKNERYSSLTFPDQDHVAGATIRPPAVMVKYLADQKGVLNGELEQFGIEQYTQLYDDLNDGWNNFIEDHTIYSSITEQSFLPKKRDNSEAGHPQDNSHELLASTVNRVVHDPQGLATALKDRPLRDKRAILAIIDAALHIIQEKHGGPSPAVKIVQQNRSAIASAWGLS